MAPGLLGASSAIAPTVTPTAVGPAGWSLTTLSLALRGAEAGILLLAASLAGILRFQYMALDGAYGLLTVLGTALYLLIAQITGIYHLKGLAEPMARLPKAVGGWSAAWILVLLLCVASKTTEDYSRIWLAAWWALGLAGLLLTRGMTIWRVRAARAAGRLAEQVVLIGGSPDLAQTKALLEGLGAQVHTALGLQGERDGEIAAAADAVRALCGSCRVDRVLLAPGRDEAALARYIEQFQFLPVETALLPPPVILDRALAAGGRDGIPVLWVVARRPLTEIDRVVKRTFDLVVGALLLIAAVPLLALIALAVRLDSRGPAVFRQQRSGFGGTAFTVYKFRTMSLSACRAGEVQQAQRWDARVTRLGRLLRRTSLDELPQLLNVLRGEMSLVGPRPHAITHDAAFAQEVKAYLARHRVKPGITGLAQVRGFRGEITRPDLLRQRVESDLAYAENWSLRLDMKILFLTVFALMGRNAY